MISPYLRRPLRSLEEMTRQQGRGVPADKNPVAKGQPAPAAQVRAAGAASSQGKTSITSNR